METIWIPMDGTKGEHFILLLEGGCELIEILQKTTHPLNPAE